MVKTIEDMGFKGLPADVSKADDVGWRQDAGRCSNGTRRGASGEGCNRPGCVLVTVITTWGGARCC